MTDEFESGEVKSLKVEFDFDSNIEVDRNVDFDRNEFDVEFDPNEFNDEFDQNEFNDDQNEFDSGIFFFICI